METFLTIFTLQNILLILLGVSLGIISGVIPGLSSTTGVALMLPFTFTMDTIPGIILLMSVYFGGMSGGLVPAILMKIPGTPAAVATCFDGYPMAQNGEPERALGIGITSSLFGGLFSAAVLILCSPLLSKFALSFGPLEYFGVAFFALMMVGAALDGDMLKSYISLAIGLLLACVGSSPIDGVPRFEFGMGNMAGGFQMMSIVIGIFAVAEMLNSVDMIGKLSVSVSTHHINMKKVHLKMSEWKKLLGNLTGASMIGTIAGVLPGLGGAAGSMMSYVNAKKTSKNPEKFGTGCAEGIVASEAANNAVTGGALIPMLSLGVPGDAPTALIMGALAIQGITMGPGLFQRSPELVSVVLYSSVIINLILWTVAIFALKLVINITKIPKHYLIPVIIVFCVIGCYSANARMFDVYVMLVFTYIGYILNKNGYSLTALILGFILGTMTEQYLRRALIYYGSFGNAMSNSTLGAIFVVLGVLYPVGSFLWLKFKKMKTATA